MLPPRRRIFLIALFIFIALGNAFACTATSNTNLPNVPEDSTKVLPLIQEQSISTFVPSTSAPGNGLAVNIIYPNKPRFKEGAPIAVVVPGGDAPSGLNLCVHAAQVGFAEIRFSFPGGGVGSFKSGGFNDYRGTKSQKALCDIVLFANGKTEDFRHKKITDLVPVKLCVNNIGIVGWSNGGNIALVTIEKYAADLSFLRWLALYECPLGSLFFPPSLGSTHDILLNSHYRQGSAATGRCLIDFRKLAWQADSRQHPGVHKKLGEPELPGVVYFDDNKNGRWDETTEFAFNYCLDRGLNKQIYPPDITSAMERLKIFNSPISPPPDQAAKATTDQSVPAAPANKALTTLASNYANTITSASTSMPTTSSNHKTTAVPQKDIADKIYSVFQAAGKFRTNLERNGLAAFTLPSKPKIVNKKSDVIDDKAVPTAWSPIVATLEEAEAYFQERDGSLSIPSICSSYPNLLITILASQVDHLQCQPDHPHIVLQYNAFLENGARWVRLNPESIYLSSLANMNKSNFVQNLPNAPIEATSIDENLEPAGALKDYVYLDATIAELADHCRSKNYTSSLSAPIYEYNNGALPAIVNTNNSKNDTKSETN